MTLIQYIKKMPVDLGQKEMRHTTFGKEIALRLAQSLKKGSGLDLGCADGFFTEKLRQQGWSMSAVDKEPSYLSAKRHDINQGIPFPDNSFDLVWSSEVIAYFDDPSFIVQEIKRVLRPRGYYIITTPNNGFWLNWFLKIFGTSLKNFQDQKQKYFFTFKDIKKLFPSEELCGFFPYIWIKFKISHFVGILSPTFIIIGKK